jgi:hypothetical protein
LNILVKYRLRKLGKMMNMWKLTAIVRSSLYAADKFILCNDSVWKWF